MPVAMAFELFPVDLSRQHPRWRSLRLSSLGKAIHYSAVLRQAALVPAEPQKLPLLRPHLTQFMPQLLPMAMVRSSYEDQVVPKDSLTIPQQVKTDLVQQSNIVLHIFF